jgi:hypothetical protein
VPIDIDELEVFALIIAICVVRFIVYVGDEFTSSYKEDQLKIIFNFSLGILIYLCMNCCLIFLFFIKNLTLPFINILILFGLVILQFVVCSLFVLYLLHYLFKLDFTIDILFKFVYVYILFGHIFLIGLYGEFIVYVWFQLNFYIFYLFLF